MFWVSYCTRKGGFRHLLIDRAKRQRVRFFVSEYILTELTDTLIDNLGKSHRFAGLARRVVLRIAKLVEIPLAVRLYVPGDRDDDPIVQTALCAKADYLVTADAEILQVGKVQDVEILTAAQFEERLGPAK